MSLKDKVENSPVKFFLAKLAFGVGAGVSGTEGYLLFMGYEVLSPAEYL